jgi:hypothetical protein
MTRFVRLYYSVKTIIPRPIQIMVRRRIALRKLLRCKDTWPIDEHTISRPPVFSCWPEQKRFSLVLTHDVDSAKGQEKCVKLAEIEEKFDFRSSFNFVPERYNVSGYLRSYLTDNGFEVGVHGLKHDGKLYASRKIFQERASKINEYLKEWKAVGFRSPAMHHNLDWLHDLAIEYDASTFDTDPFEPQPTGLGTIFPLWVKRNSNQGGYVELPYTLPQDFTLFILLREKSIDMWKLKLDWVAEKGGMALINVHPDYINFDEGNPALEEYPVQYYKQFLQYVKTRYEGAYWHVLPKDMARFWSKNAELEQYSDCR